MEAFCEAQGVRFERCGKLVVATRETALPRLEALRERALANGLAVESLGPEALREREPHAVGIRALWIPETGIVDYREVARTMRGLLIAQGVDVRTSQAVLEVQHRPGALVLETTRGDIETDFVLNCGGLHADRLARRFGLEPGIRIIPFRGEYFHLTPEASAKVRTLIYPVPDPDLPFLGVHLTRGIHGTVEAGPNAVLAFAREGYRRRDLSLRDLAEYAAFPGLWRMGRHWWRTGVYEWRRSLSRKLFLRDLRELVPDLMLEDLSPGGSGVRAQAVDRQGRLADDFLFVEGPRSFHVLNAPSPAATASLAIGRHIALTSMGRMLN
jgi:L-2-hydroxyglutarate oxidase